MDDIWDRLYACAKAVINPMEVSHRISIGSVGAAVLTKSGKIFTGVCIDTSSSLGMCAERNAISTMLTNGEYEIDRVVSVYKTGEVIPPCGACREFMMQLRNGKDITVLLNREGKTRKMQEILPEYRNE